MKSQMAAAVLIALAIGGCAHKRYFTDGKTPEIVISADNRIYFHDELVSLKDLVKRLESRDYPKDRNLPIRVKNLQALRPANAVVVYLSHCGWKHAILVTEKHSASEVRGVAPQIDERPLPAQQRHRR